MFAVIALAVAGCKGDTPNVEPVKPVGEKPEISVREMDLTTNSFTFEVSANVAGEAGYAVVAEGYKAPSINDLFAVNSAQVEDVEVITVEGLNDNTNYTLYIVFRAAADGSLSDPQTLKFTTLDDGVENPISIDNVTFDTITFTINIAGSYLFQCIDKAYIEYSNITIEEYITMQGIGIPASGPQTVDWYDGGIYGNYEMRVREDSDYYVVAAIANGQTVVGDIYVVETRTPKRPTSTAGLTTELLDITSTSVNIKTTPDNSVVEYYVLVRDKMWSDSIVAGYDDLMEEFIHSNPGLESRFNRFLHFEDYTVEEMMDIFAMQCSKGHYELAEDAREQVEAFIREENDGGISFGNARGVRNLFEQILVQQANRLAGMESVTRKDLTQLLRADVEAARNAAEK